MKNTHHRGHCGASWKDRENRDFLREENPTIIVQMSFVVNN
jgi:hypothetical protein